jgi:hypothetical protein
METFFNFIGFVLYYSLVAAMIVIILQLALLMPWVFLAVFILSLLFHSDR